MTVFSHPALRTRRNNDDRFQTTAHNTVPARDVGRRGLRAAMGIVIAIGGAKPVGELLAAEQQQSGKPASDAESATYVLPVIEAVCLDCHGEDEPEAGLSLAGFRGADQVLASRKVWENVYKQLRIDGMPAGGLRAPTDRPAAAGRSRLAGPEAVPARSRAYQDDPGRITIHRLNRREYNNTVRDLLGIDFRPADDFPSDDVGYGFNNIADVLSLPPLFWRSMSTPPSRSHRR